MKPRRFCFAVLAAGAIVTACASAATPGAYSPYQYENGYAAPSAAPAATQAAAPGAGNGGQPVPAASQLPKSGGNGGNAAGPTSAVPQPEDQIIKTGSISIEVQDLDQSIAKATDQIHGLGGWLAGSDRSLTSAQAMASVTYRIPANRFEDALAAMRVLGLKVLGEHTDSQSVGGTIVDLQARIDNLRASEKAIQAIMAKANTIGDVLTVQQRLAEVQGQIEELSAQLASLSNQAAYSTLTVIFDVPLKPTPTPTPTPTPSPSPTIAPVPWSAGDQAGQAAGALGEVGKAVATVAIWFAVLIVPIGIGLLLGLLLILVLVRLGSPLVRRIAAASSQPTNPGSPTQTQA
jgi:hypothetical protein